MYRLRRWHGDRLSRKELAKASLCDQQTNRKKPLRTYFMSLIEAVLVSIALFTLVYGWKLARVAVALGYGAAAGAITASFTGLLGFIQNNGAGETLGQAALWGSIAVAIGTIFGWALQRYAAAAFPFIATFLLTRATDGSDLREGTALVLALVAGVFIFVLYDFFSAALMAVLVSPLLIPEGGSLWSSLSNAVNFHNLNILNLSISSIVLPLLQVLLQYLASVTLFPAWLALSAVCLRNFAWQKDKDTTDAWSLKPDWNSAIVSATLITTLSTWLSNAFDIIDPIGAQPMGFLWTTIACLFAIRSLSRVPAKDSGLNALLWLLPTTLLVLPLSTALQLAVFTDPFALPKSFSESHTVSFLISFYGGLFWPRATLGHTPILGTIAYFFLRWSLALVLVPALLRAIARSNGLTFATDNFPFSLHPRLRNLGIAVAVFSVSTVILSVRSGSPAARERQLASLAESLSWQSVPRTEDCSLRFTNSRVSPRNVSDQNILRALLPNANSDNFGQSITNVSNRRYRARACRGVIINTAGNDGAHVAVRQPLSDKRLFVMVHTRADGASDNSNFSGLQAVLSIERNVLRVDALRPWNGRANEHSRAELLALASGPVIVEYLRPYGPDEPTTRAVLLRVRRGMLDEFATIATREDINECLMESPWRNVHTATLRASGPTVIVSHRYRFSQAQCVDPPSPGLPTVNRQAEQRIDPSTERVDLTPPPEATPPPLPQVWLDYLSAHPTDAVDDHAADLDEPESADTPAPTPPTPTPTPAAPATSSIVLRPDRITASSFYSRRHERHPPEDAFDGRLETAWNDGVRGSGRGEWIEAQFDTAHHFDLITFSTGFDHVTTRSEDLFSANAHLRTATISIDGRAVHTINIAHDQRQATVDLGRTLGRTVRITATDVWNGSRWQDVCLSEITLTGSP